MSMNRDNNFINRFLKGGNKKLLLNLAIIILAGILLILISDIVGNLTKKKAPVKDNGNVEVDTNSALPVSKAGNDYEDTLKNDLASTLSQIQGVGRISVMIYFESGEESVPGVNKNNNSKKTEEKDTEGGTRNTIEDINGETTVLLNKGSDTEPFIVKKVKPKIGGVMVVAEGADNIAIKEQLLNSVRTLLNIPASKVAVMTMKK